MHFLREYDYGTQITIKGLTGDVKFDENGLRSDVTLRLLELTREGLKQVRTSRSLTAVEAIKLHHFYEFFPLFSSLQVGEWTPHNQVTFMQNYTKAMEEGYRQTLKNKTLVVVTNLVGITKFQRKLISSLFIQK